MPINSSSETEDSHDPNSLSTKFFGREKPLYYVLGGGQFADLLLWRNKTLSAAVLAAVTMIWFLLEVVEYNFVSLVCHITILVMLVKLLADLFWAYTMAKVLAALLSNFVGWKVKYEISSWENFVEYFLVIAGLWMTSVIGNYFSSLNLLFFGALCLGTLPALYEQYESEVNHLILKGCKDVRKVFKRFYAEVLNKIPRRRVKEKKRK